MNPLVAIAGPTAIGKTDLAFSLAAISGVEIVNADSRQVYRYMNIGTAKPTHEEQAAIPHHLFDIVDPDEAFSLALYQPLAYKAIEDIQSRGKLPLLVGGSGQYIWSVIEGWQLPKVTPDPELRNLLEDRAAREGVDSLYQELRSIDPAAAAKIDPRNVRRVIRALEVCRSGGSFSQLQKKNPPPFETIIIGLTTERQELYRRIDSRVDRMIEQGLVEEVQDLLSRGYDLSLPAMSSVGYRQIAAFLRGELDLPTAAEQIKFETHRFARHQYAWFRLKDPRIHWFKSPEAAMKGFTGLINHKIKSDINIGKTERTT